MDKLTIPAILPDIVNYYKTNLVGGNLHLVLENGNIKDKHVLFCMNEAEKNKDIEGYKIAQNLLKMSKTQRFKLYSIKKD